MPRSAKRPPAPPLPEAPAYQAVDYVDLWGSWNDDERRAAVIRQRGWPEDSTEEDKQVYADIEVARVNNIFDRLESLSDQERQKLIARSWEVNEQQVERIVAVTEARQRYVADRHINWMILRLLGVRQAEIARRSGVTPKVVSDAIGRTVDPHGPSGRSGR